ncbi:hypothetical protein M8C21_005133 [Ambrosia artemisiifolia]|uniref:Mitochondrial import inner membrane translocase subunit TIM50 n=1 Tax=Ambrosia artemisiifolia TaxID=4212 RepID=A0AAD5GJ95_AMBAR|nr:hypothetical protein M8C21_005133 [Ambrosia artemisiifolia]
MGNVTSIWWSKREEGPKTANGGETNSSTNSNFDVSISMSEKTINDGVGSIETEIIDVKMVSEEVERTEKANGEASKKRKRRRRRNKKLPTGEELRVQAQVNDCQQVDTRIVRSPSEKLRIGDVEIFNKKNFFTRSKKMLLILDLNGLLADVINPPPKDCKPDIKISRRAIFKRPFLDDFLGFCFQRFDVAIWSSRTRKILDPVVDYLLGDLKKKLVFIWDLSHCTNSSSRSLENYHKFIVFKKLGKIWEGNGRIASENGYYDESNTLLLDDSPYKALLNPKHTGIFPLSYKHKDINDKSLGPDGDLRIYLEGVAASENVKTYVEQHPFGQRAIDETSPDWAFYSRVLKNVF